MGDSESNTDSEEQRDTVPELKPIPKDKSKGKQQMTTNPEMMSEIDVLTLKARGIVIDEAKTSSPVVDSLYKLRSGYKGRAIVVAPYPLTGSAKESSAAVDSKPETRSAEGSSAVVASIPETRSVARKRKEKQIKGNIFGRPTRDSEEVCKRFKKGRNDDDDIDKDGAGAGARTTRTSSRKRKVMST